MYFCKKGRFYVYNYAFNLEEFEPFFRKMMTPVPKLTSLQEAHDFLNGDGLRVLGLFYEDDRDDTSDYM